MSTSSTGARSPRRASLTGPLRVDPGDQTGLLAGVFPAAGQALGQSSYRVCRSQCGAKIPLAIPDSQPRGSPLAGSYLADEVIASTRWIRSDSAANPAAVDLAVVSLTLTGW